MVSPTEILKSLGGLHDARITSLIWTPLGNIFDISVDDIFSNFAGLPEYKGRFPGSLRFLGVISVMGNVLNCDEHLKIYDFDITQKADNLLIAKIAFWPSGKLEIHATRIEFPESPWNQVTSP